MSSSRGFTIIELLIATFIIGTVVTGLFGLFVLSLRSSQEGERRVVAVALANERAEMIRNLPYQNVGTVGGVPAGGIITQETINRNNVNYAVRTDIRYVDDPYDGVAGGNPNDLLNTDYKRARVEVSWSGPNPAKPILLIADVAPPGIEGGEAAGTLFFQALDAGGAAIAGATVGLVNASVNPAINITTQTDDNGLVVLPGLPEASESYALTVAKTGYISEQTYDATANFTPDSDHAHLTMLTGQLTPKTFVIDHPATLNISSQPNIAYHLQGTKTIGTDSVGALVYVVDADGATNAAGQSNHADLVWDAYDLTIDGVATGYDIKETSQILPVTLNPGDNLDLAVTLVPHTPISLQVSVVNATVQPVDNAIVNLAGNSLNETLGTGPVGQVFFDDLPINGDYTLTIDAPGYAQAVTSVTVTDTSRSKITVTTL